MSDLTLLTYAAAIILDFVGATFFGWWWNKCGRASSMFIAVTFLLLGDMLDKVVTFYARVLLACGMLAERAALHESFLWAARSWVELGATAFIVWIVVDRVFDPKKYFALRRREGDNR